MKVVGIICEYNPFHNGHVYHINKTKELFPDAIIVLVLNGYFLERGEISLLSKEDKTTLALNYGVDIVVALPAVFGTQSADIFAERSVEILSHLGASDIVFGSESNDVQLLTNMAKMQFDSDYNKQVKKLLKEGVNYPTALSKAFPSSVLVTSPNDLLGISYAKAILKHNYPITLHTIQRTNDYHDVSSNASIISASNIRNKIQNNEDVSFSVPEGVSKRLITVNEDKLWDLIQFRILTDPDLSQYLTVDEGIEKRLLASIEKANNLNEFIQFVKTKRYTYNKIRRMIIHLLLGITKQDNLGFKLDYLQILGFSKQGQAFLSKNRKQMSLPFQNKESKVHKFEKRAAFLYDELTNSNTYEFERKNKPIIK